MHHNAKIPFRIVQAARQDEDNEMNIISLGAGVQSSTMALMAAAWFVHRSRKPLAEVDFRTAEEAGQINMFGNECEGMCGV